MQLYLTDAAVASLASEQQSDVYDTVVKRFGVRVSKTRKTFFVLAGEPRRRISLGQYPDVSLKAARKAAQRHILNPKTVTASRTLKSALQTYFETYVDPNYRPNSAYQVKRLFARIAHLEDNLLTDLKSSHLTDVLDKQTPSQANHLYSVLKTFFGWCERRDYIDASPIRKLTKPHKEKERKRTLTDAELKAVWNACDDDSFGKIVRMLILTGQRRGEIAALESGWLASDETNTPLSITFPPHITKNGEQHTIPLAQNAKNLLSEALHAYPRMRDSNSTLLFPSPKKAAVLLGFQKMKWHLDERSGVSDWTLHDLRRTWSTKSADLGAQPHIIERCLNHLTGSMTPLARRYNKHQYITEMREAFERYDAYISSLIHEAT